MKFDLLKEESLENPEINLTPLIDVVFVILIMFIVVVPLLKVDRVELAHSVMEEGKGRAEEGPVVLHVYPDNSLSLNGKIIRLEELGTRLALEKKKNMGGQLTLFHDKNGSFGTYQSIKEIAEIAGFTELHVILR